MNESQTFIVLAAPGPPPEQQPNLVFGLPIEFALPVTFGALVLFAVVAMFYLAVQGTASADRADVVRAFVGIVRAVADMITKTFTAIAKLFARAG